MKTTVMSLELTLRSQKLSEQTESEQQKLILVALCNPQIFKKDNPETNINF